MVKEACILYPQGCIKPCIDQEKDNPMCVLSVKYDSKVYPLEDREQIEADYLASGGFIYGRDLPTMPTVELPKRDH
jgi:hypothetical protein